MMKKDASTTNDTTAAVALVSKHVLFLLVPSCLLLGLSLGVASRAWLAHRAYALSASLGVAPACAESSVTVRRASLFESRGGRRRRTETIRQVASLRTPHHEIDVRDHEIVDASSSDAEPTVAVERRVRVDGEHRSAADHEFAVHPALLAHPWPERVLILGGGDGAWSREVSKHDSVTEVVSVERDEEYARFARRYSGRDDDDDDPRSAEVLGVDEFAWANATNQRFDVVLVDPSRANDLRNDDGALLRALVGAATESGVISFRLGRTEELAVGERTAATVGRLSRFGVRSTHVYEELYVPGRPSYQIVVACLRFSCREEWYANAARTEYKLRSRLSPTASLTHYDAATAVQHQRPHKRVERLFCETTTATRPPPLSCETHRGFASTLRNVYASDFSLRPSAIGDGVGLGMFARTNVPAGASLAVEQRLDPVYFDPGMIANVEAFEWTATTNGDGRRTAPTPRDISLYVDHYGFESDSLGRPEWFVESGILSFANHGCGGTWNAGPATRLDPRAHGHECRRAEVEVETRSESDEGPSSRWTEPCGIGHDPVVDRHRTQVNSVVTTALRDLRAGEEILTNYLPYVKNSDDREAYARELRTMCGGAS